MSARDELIEMLSFAEQLHAEDYRPEHGADAALAWLGEQFDERLRARVADAINCEADWDVSGLGSADFGVMREIREHLGLDDAAQNTQDAP